MCSSIRRPFLLRPTSVPNTQERGLAALKGLNLVVDGINERAFVSPKRNQMRSYPHNRLGATFLPTPAHTNQLVARVAGNSPASEAGIRDSDILLRIGDRAVTRIDFIGADALSEPAGAKLKLTLSRDGQTF